MAEEDARAASSPWAELVMALCLVSKERFFVMKYPDRR